MTWRTLALSGSIREQVWRSRSSFVFPIDAGSFVYALPLVAFAGAFITACLIYFFSYDRFAELRRIQVSAYRRRVFHGVFRGDDCLHFVS